MTSPYPTPLRVRLSLLICAICVICGPQSSAAQLPTPAEHAAKVRANPNLQVEGRVTGEGFCWHAAYAADSFVMAYLATQDPEWLVEGQRYFDWLVGLMAKGPDGYRGWIGPFIYDKSVWCDVHVGDAILVNPMLRFAEVVLDDSDLEKRFGKAARKYVDLAKRDLIEKWDARGTWREVGPFGAYASWDHYLPPGNFSEWKQLPVGKSNLSLPHNKQLDVAVAALRLYRITNERPYRDRAFKIFNRLRASFQRVDDHYVWNYWEPAGPWDVDEEGKLRHWVNVHPYRNYQAGEVHDIVEAYHTGVAITREDIQALINTNLHVMWNGDVESPAWRNSNATGPWEAPPPPPRGWKGRAGTLWSALDDFDETIRSLHAARLKEGTIEHAYFNAVTMKRPVTFARRYTDAGVAIDFHPTVCADIHLAAALPPGVSGETSTLLVSKALGSGTLDIALYDNDGKVRIGDIAQFEVAGTAEGRGGVTMHRWCPGCAGVAPGMYRIRWTLDAGYREYPFRVEE